MELSIYFFEATPTCFLGAFSSIFSLPPIQTPIVLTYFSIASAPRMATPQLLVGNPSNS